MVRALTVVAGLALAVAARAQPAGHEAQVGLTIGRAVHLPLNAVKMFDRAQEAWTWTFGQEPGAALLRAERGAGVIEGTARVNFRSAMLTMREETMGTVRYRVTVQVKAGECRVQVSELVHTGNRSALRGGSDVGLVVRGEGPVQRVRGMSRGNAARLHEEVRTAATDRITTLLQQFEARMRAGGAE
ncbi:MAG: hypothetical protein RBT71_03335 [Flavobacteriales bacterium]|jgi:hypothetical protein|nr:hypothetical protein [Flavobacteriales bacterium]